jgi:hypothetical protein
MTMSQERLVIDKYALTVPQELYLFGGAYESSTGMSVVEAFSPSSHNMRQVVLDVAPRSFAAGAVFGRGVCICGGASEGEEWLSTCKYYAIDSQTYKVVRSCIEKFRQNYVIISAWGLVLVGIGTCQQC